MPGENSYKEPIDQAKREIAALVLEIKKIDEAVKLSSGAIRKHLGTAFKGTSAADLNKMLQQTKKALDGVTQSTKQQDAAMKKREAALKRQADLEYRFATQKVQAQEKEFQQLQKSTQANNKLLASQEKAAKAKEKEAAAINKLSGNYATLLAQQKAAKLVLQNEIAARNQNSKAIRVAQKEYDRLSLKINQAATATARSTAIMQVAVSRLKSLAVAFGFFGTIFLIASTIKDAIQRVRDFDKEMQTMAGVLRTTRGELESLEAKIKDVASQSIMTSNDVAKLATSLLVLGKSKEDVERLLQPANDLGIALNTTSEAAGEFLVQSLNSFGASSREAAKFADVIATIRTSTSLDFQKMVDSFQYLSPISRVLGEDLAYTGAIIGILADNGLKAQQAGRLLGTAQQKLAKEGRSLSEALELVNKAAEEGKTGQEQLAIASKLFGAQAGKIGVVLANNSHLIQENAAEIRANGGALDDLVKQKMEAFDAKLEMLNSAWEKWILSLKSGQGVMGKVFLGTIDSLTKIFNGIADMNDEFKTFIALGKSTGNASMFKMLQDDVDNLGGSIELAAKNRLPSLIAIMEDYEQKLKALTDKEARMQDLKKNEVRGFPSWELMGYTLLNPAIDYNIKLYGKKVAKYREMVAVAREAMGLERDAGVATAKNFDTNDYETVTSALVYMKKELEKIDEVAKKGVLSEELLRQKGIIEKNIIALNRYQSTAVNNAWYFGKSLDEEKKRSEDGITLIKDKIYWEEQLKAATIDWNATKTTDTEGRADADKRIKQAEKELELWERKNKTAKESKVIIAGSVAALEKLKSALEDEQSRLATNTEAWKDYQSQIDGVTAKIEHLKIGLEAIGKIETGGVISFSSEMPDTGNENLTDMIEGQKAASAVIRTIKEDDYTYIALLENDELARLKTNAEEQLAIAEKLGEDELKAAEDKNKEELDALKKQQEHRRKIIEEAIELEKELRRDLADSVIDLGESILDAQVAKVDDEIDENKRFYAAKLDDENLSEEQRSAIEAERDRKELELQKKKKKRENEAFLFTQAIALAEIGINLARTLSAITTAAAVIAASAPWPFGVVNAALYTASAVPVAIATAAASAGAVVAQSISAFEGGTDNAPEGWALVDEKRPEVHTDKDGNVKTFGSDKPNYRYLEKGDKIVKSHEDFFSRNNEEEINRAVFNLNMQSNGEQISRHQTDNALRDEMRRLNTSNEKVWKEVKKLASRPINNKVTVINEDKRSY